MRQMTFEEVPEREDRAGSSKDPLGDERALVVDRPQRDFGYAEWNQRRGVAVDDRVDVGARPVDLAVDESLPIRRPAACVDGRMVSSHWRRTSAPFSGEMTLKPMRCVQSSLTSH